MGRRPAIQIRKRLPHLELIRLAPLYNFTVFLVKYILSTFVGGTTQNWFLVFLKNVVSKKILFSFLSFPSAIGRNKNKATFSFCVLFRFWKSCVEVLGYQFWYLAVKFLGRDFFFHQNSALNKIYSTALCSQYYYEQYWTSKIICDTSQDIFAAFLLKKISSLRILAGKPPLMQALR